VILGLSTLAACTGGTATKKNIVEERPPAAEAYPMAQADASRAAAEEQEAKEAAARAAAQEAAARAEKEAALQKAAAARAELDRSAGEAASLKQKQIDTMPDPESPFDYSLESAGSSFRPQVTPLPGDPAAYAPLPGFQEMAIPADNPLTAEKAALGRQLYYDQRLSGDGKHSCYGCHVREHGLTDGLALCTRGADKPLTRSAPTMWILPGLWALYWDGRAPTLEKQAMGAWKGVNMGATDPETIVAQLNAVPGYRAQFQVVFGGPVTSDNVTKALASYMRTIVGGHTPFDAWLAADNTAISEAAVRGWDVFQRAGCAQCHSGVLITDMQFHNIGIGMDKADPDLGRFKVTNLEQDKGAFKTPTLRDVSRSAPYFHDGSAATLEEAVDLMLAGGKPNPWLSVNLLKRVELGTRERADLLEFLRSLDEPCDFTTPPLPMDG